MYIVNIIERQPDPDDYSSFVVLVPLNSIQFESKKDAQRWLNKQDFVLRPYHSVYQKGNDIAYITEVVAGYPDYAGVKWNEGHAE